MSATIFFAEGSDLYMGSGTTIATPGTWTSLGCIRNVTPNKINRAFREVKPCLNDTDRTIRKKPNSVDFGSVTATLIFDATQFDALQVILIAGTTKPIATILGDSLKARKCEAYIESMGVPQLAEDGEVQVEVSFVVNTLPTTVASSTIIAGS